jgi:hypothetical protein
MHIKDFTCNDRIIEPKNISKALKLRGGILQKKEMELFSLVKIGLKEYKSKALKLRGQKLQVQFW